MQLYVFTSVLPLYVFDEPFCFSPGYKLNTCNRSAGGCSVHVCFEVYAIVWKKNNNGVE